MTAPARSRQLVELADMVKLPHSLFALPFALTGMLAAAGGLPSWWTIGLIVACMVTARTAAMTWNRIADARFDAENPRTKSRGLPAGRVSRGAAWTLLLVSCVLFVAATSGLNRLTLVLSPVALLVVLGYSLTKRFTWASHFVLGLSLGIAPVGAWIAVRGDLTAEPLALCASVLLWTAGFDILYACQDVDFDRQARLQSLPARFGIPAALWVSGACHVAAVAGLVAFGALGHRGAPYFACVGLAAAVLAWSHLIVKASDLSRLGLAFFQANVAVGALVLAGMAWEVFG